MKNILGILASIFLLLSSMVSAGEFIKHLKKDQKSPIAQIEQVSWIAGTWKGEAFGGKTEEIWSAPSVGTMMASFRLIKDGKIAFYEFEVIREIGESLILQLKHFSGELKGWENKDEMVSFPLVEIGKGVVYFDGMTFKKMGADEMHVYVDIDGTETLFSYKRDE